VNYSVPMENMCGNYCEVTKLRRKLRPKLPSDKVTLRPKLRPKLRHVYTPWANVQRMVHLISEPCTHTLPYAACRVLCCLYYSLYCDSRHATGAATQRFTQVVPAAKSSSMAAGNIVFCNLRPRLAARGGAPMAPPTRP
jgi:hypothetical protein